MRNFIVVAAVLGLATLGPALGSLREASACSPPYKPEPKPARAVGIHSVLVSASGRLPRDGGLRFVADVEGVDMAALLSKVTIKVTAGGAPVTGELRAFPTENPVSSLDLQFVPTGGLLPVTKELHVELTYVQASGAEEAPKSFDNEVDDVRLVDLALPELNLQMREAYLRADNSSPPVRCILKTPNTYRGGSPCGGDDMSETTLTETTFPSKQVRQQAAELRVVGRYNYGVEGYVTYSSRVSWPGDPAGWNIGYFGDGYSFVVPDAAKGEVCFEVTADSKSLPGFPKTVKSCRAIPEVLPITPAEDKAYFDKASEQCRELIAPAGVTIPATTVPTTTSGAGNANGAAPAKSDDGDGGCSVHGGRAGSPFVAGVAVAIGLLLVGRRRRNRLNAG